MLRGAEGKVKTTYREAIRAAIREALERDPLLLRAMAWDNGRDCLQVVGPLPWTGAPTPRQFVRDDDRALAKYLTKHGVPCWPRVAVSVLRRMVRVTSKVATPRPTTSGRPTPCLGPCGSCGWLAFGRSCPNVAQRWPRAGGEAA
jgi:hypothetical protein